MSDVGTLAAMDAFAGGARRRPARLPPPPPFVPPPPPQRHDHYYVRRKSPVPRHQHNLTLFARNNGTSLHSPAAGSLQLQRGRSPRSHTQCQCHATHHADMLHHHRSLICHFMFRNFRNFSLSLKLVSFETLFMTVNYSLITIKV
ncbi:hypothetical protein O0L34_g7175 [Tuta absoluta]|nr:hypothetical protein O0L34_g7175 [Tuta absoluta]